MAALEGFDDGDDNMEEEEDNYQLYNLSEAASEN